MKRIGLRELQRNIGQLSIDLIRGEEIILTRNGKDFAKLVAVAPKLPKLGKFKAPKDYPPMPRLPKAEAIKEAQSIIHEVETSVAGDALIQHKCDAPQINCRFPGELYEVQYQGEDSIIKKQVYLCPGHAKKARESSTTESMQKL
jgi:antitoxin (DNA-binding transcriptional repressor) of toxin-antitoxin stability system